MLVVERDDYTTFVRVASTLLASTGTSGRFIRISNQFALPFSFRRVVGDNQASIADRKTSLPQEDTSTNSLIQWEGLSVKKKQNPPRRSMAFNFLLFLVTTLVGAAAGDGTYDNHENDSVKMIHS